MELPPEANLQKTQMSATKSHSARPFAWGGGTTESLFLQEIALLIKKKKIDSEPTRERKSWSWLFTQDIHKPMMNLPMKAT